MIDKRILALLAIIAVLAIAVGYGLYTNQETPNVNVNNTTAVNNTTVKNATLNQSTSTSDSPNGEYGYCAICGNALTYSEANNDYTQGKVCHSCASNPYYQTDEGAQYANKKLYEAYPDEYEWRYDESSDDSADYNNDNIEHEDNRN